MIIGVLKEASDENRVALLPESVADFIKLNVEVLVENDAGQSAYASDNEYTEAGGKLSSRQEVISKSDVIVCVNPPENSEIDTFAENKVFIAHINALSNHDLVNKLKDKNITSFALDMIPRTSRAQAMDILSSMATVSGYKAVLDAAMNQAKFFPMFMTAAGSITPSKVLILGAGVAGLQAISTARRLGGVVEAFDVRAAVKEEVESLGAKFVEVEGATDDAAAGGYAVEQSEEFKQKQRQVIQDHVAASNVVICTAQIPGRQAPVLVEKSAVERMKPGSVIIDLAASSGGNCELTENNTTVEHKGVKIIGQSNYPSTMPFDASKMFGKNILNFMKLMIDEGNLNLNFEDDIIEGSCITHNKEIKNARVNDLLTAKA